MWNRAISLLSDVGYQVGIGLVTLLIVASVTRIYRAIRNWRAITERMASSKKDRQHQKLTRIFIQSVNRSPLILANAITYFLFVVVALLASGAVYQAAISRTVTVAKAMSADAAVTKETAGDAVSSQSTDVALALAIGNAAPSVITLIVFLPLTAYVAFFWMPDRLTALPLAVWLDQYATRLFAMCTKDEARQLAILELCVRDEESLRSYLTRLRQLSRQYDFPLLSQVGAWLDQNEALRSKASATQDVSTPA